MITEIRAYRPDFRRGISICVFQFDRNREYLGELTFSPIEKGASISEPTINLDMRPMDTAAQVLMDDLWNCGIRPSEGTGSAGSLKATQYHLEDMRKLIFEGDKK